MRQRQRGGANPAALSVAEIRRRQAARQNEVTAGQHDLLSKARNAEANDKPAVARIYYRILWRDATGPLKDQLAAKLAALGTRGAKDQSIARR